jgi:hypothetical protein
MPVRWRVTHESIQKRAAEGINSVSITFRDQENKRGVEHCQKGMYADPRVLEAGLNLPRLITGLSDEDFATAEKYYVEAAHGPALEKIQNEAEAWDLADATVRAATQLVYDAGGFSHQHEFNEFWKAHDKVDGKKEAEQLNKLAAEDLVAQLRSLPMDERIKITSTMIDKNLTDVVQGAA